jgi:hypothetical protein
MKPLTDRSRKVGDLRRDMSSMVERVRLTASGHKLHFSDTSSWTSFLEGSRVTDMWYPTELIWKMATHWHVVPHRTYLNHGHSLTCGTPQNWSETGPLTEIWYTTELIWTMATHWHVVPHRTDLKQGHSLTCGTPQKWRLEEVRNSHYHKI